MKLRDIIADAADEFRAVMGADAKWADSIAGAGENADPCGGPTAADTFTATFDPALADAFLALYVAAIAETGMPEGGWTLVEWVNRTSTAAIDLRTLLAERGLR